MDTPTIIIITSLVISIGFIVFLKLKVIKDIWIALASLWFGSIWFIVTSLGEVLIGWGFNPSCSKYLGCGSGFFGYDAFEHFFFGVALGFFILWISQKSEKYSLEFKQRWKIIIIVIAIVALVSVLWEMFECAYDAFRVSILHENLFNFRLHINMLEQPSNIDTMGDLSFALLGSVVSIIISYIIDSSSLIKNKFKE